MNANRFRKQVHRHSQKGVDWTNKQRVSFTVLVDKSTVTTQKQRLLVGEVQSWTSGLKCPESFTDHTSPWLVFGSGVTHKGYSSTAEVASHAQICYRLLRRSGIRFKIRPVAPLHFIADASALIEPVDYYEEFVASQPPFSVDDFVRKHSAWKYSYRRRVRATRNREALQ